ncbi:MAG: glycosyltransferase family 39 protein [Pseudomonadota bacterium]
MKRPSTYGSMWKPLMVLTGIWAAIIVIVNPVGEFMINDDWAFVRCLESLMREGRLETTGHGPLHAPGGPALITHLLWGLAFVKAAGFSLTVLRLSVLTLGVLASLVVFLLLRRCGASTGLSMLGTLSLVFNPLFLSQCFSFMTDITFTSFALVSVLFFHIGVEKSNTGIIIIGLAFALAATLTRQLGLALPIGFVAACFLHPKGEELGRLKMTLLAAGIAVVPWIGYEIFLQQAGSTPIVEHSMLRNAVKNACSMGPLRYADFLLRHLLVSTLGYVCFLISPVLALYYGTSWSSGSFRCFAICLTAVLSACEVSLLLGIVDFPVIMNGNVIYNLGIGPIVLRDTYIMGLERSAALPKALYAVIVYWTIIAAAVLGTLAIRGFRGPSGQARTPDGSATGFTAVNCALTALVYMAVIVPLPPYDRYLILPCALLIVWLVAGTPSPKAFVPSLGTAVSIAAPLICLAVFSVFGTRDFLEMKRSLSNAHDYVLNVLKVNPCRVDGGFEFNGYHCYRKGMPHQTGLSWWWVEKEEYLITLGTLPGYRVVRTFPFPRLLGPDGAVHLLEPAKDE